MSYKSLDGIAIKFPDLSDRALMNIYPCTFMRKLLLRNPEMPCRLLTINSITCVFRAMLAERCLQESQYSDLSEQYGTAVERVSENLLRWSYADQKVTVGGLGRLEVVAPNPH